MKQYYKQIEAVQSKAIQETMNELDQYLTEQDKAERKAVPVVINLNDFGFDFKKRTETQQAKDDGILKEFK